MNKDKLYTYRDSDEKWHLIENGIPATVKQIQFMKKLGWKYTNFTKYGAHIIIKSILEM